MKHRTHLLMCLVLIGGYLIAYLFIPQVKSLGWLGFIILICPLLHLGMMRGDHSHKTEDKGT